MSSTPTNSPILIVEDDANIRETLDMILKLEGYQTLLAGNGQEALAILEKSPKPGLVILDLMMPIMDGWEFLEVIKDKPEIAKLPIVVVSAAEEGLIRSAKATEYLKKPLDVDKLLAVVERHCPPQA